MKLLYSTIYTEDGISRTQLAQRTHLSKTTISTLVDELIDLKFVTDEGVTQHSDCVGRKPNGLKAQTGQHYVVVINWIEHVIETNVVDIAGTSVYCTKEHMVDQETYISLTRQCLYHDILKRFDTEQILGICIVVSGIIDPEHRGLYSTTLSLGTDVSEHIIQELENAFPDFPVVALEDTACYAYAEKIYTQVNEKNYAFINFGRGIGATIFIEGKMLGKASGAITQFGHYSTGQDGPLCACGNRGCLEAMFSETQLKQRLKEIDPENILLSSHTLTFRDIGNAAIYKNPAAIKLIRYMARELALAIDNLICIVNPDLIVLGGKCQDLDSLFLTELKEAVKNTGFRYFTDRVQIRYSELHSNSYLNGAMRYFFDTYYSFYTPHKSDFHIG